MSGLEKRRCCCPTEARTGRGSVGEPVLEREAGPVGRPFRNDRTLGQPEGADPHPEVLVRIISQPGEGTCKK